MGRNAKDKVEGLGVQSWVLSQRGEKCLPGFLPLPTSGAAAEAHEETCAQGLDTVTQEQRSHGQERKNTREHDRSEGLRPSLQLPSESEKHWYGEGSCPREASQVESLMACGRPEKSHIGF